MNFDNNMGARVDKDVMDWAESKECSKTCSNKVAKMINKYQLRELKEWQKSSLNTFVTFCTQDMKLDGIELLDFSSALRDTEF